MKAYRYNWCTHFSDHEWVHIIVFAEDRASADAFARKEDNELARLLDDVILAIRKKFEVIETDIRAGVYVSLLVR